MASFHFSKAFQLTITAVILLTCASSVHAFGAGNIASVSQVEGINFRHGDIEDTLLTILTSYAYGKGAKFSKLDVKRVYFGNWLRDYSQAIDVGTVKHVSSDAIRILLWVLGFLSFGYGTGEFEVTSERLGCYRPEEHIDNPKDYADNEDARQYDPRLRGPVNEEVELAVDPETGLKNYIANERARITTSAGLVRNLFGRAIHLGRQYSRSRNKADFYEALRLLGTGCHCLEDYSAHSNYVELALIELGEHAVFPHVGRKTQIHLPGAHRPVYPIVTGTFGGVDFLHSVMGELDDKTTQSEIQELEGVMQQSQGQDTSFLRSLLSSLPSGLFGGKDQAGRIDELQQNATQAQMQNMNISPHQPEAWTKQLNNVSQQIYPILEFHDEIMQQITETIDKIPVLPDLIEKFQEQISIFVFSLIAPFVLPIIRQVQTELATGSSEVIQSSRDKQLIVFHDDYSTDPTHSMLSKDHFSNLLNEPAGKVSCEVLKWVVPQIISCMDDDSIDVDRTLNRVIHGIFHHPAMRGYGDDGARDGRGIMFSIVQNWWGSKPEHEKTDLRHRLSREGVETGQNHKDGVEDKGHGCGKPIGLAKPSSQNAPAAAAHTAVMQALSGGQNSSGHGGSQSESQPGNFLSEAVGGGLLGSLIGGVGASLLGSAFESSSGGGQTQTFQSSSYNEDGSYTSSTMQTGHRPGYDSGRYGEQTAQAEYKTTQYPGGGYRQEYDRFDQSGNSGSGYEHSTETRPIPGGGYEQRSEERWERPDGRWESEVQEQGVRKSGQYYHKEEHHHGRRRDGSDEESDENDDDDYEKKERKRLAKERKRREEEELRRRGEGSGNDSDGSRHGHRKHHGREEHHYGEGHHQQRPMNDYAEAGYGREGLQSHQNRYESSSGYERPEPTFGYGQERPHHSEFQERPPHPRSDFEGGGFSDHPGGFNRFEPPPPDDEFANRGYGGDYSEPPRHQEYGGDGDFPDEEEGRRPHGHRGHHGGHHGGGYGEDNRGGW